MLPLYEYRFELQLKTKHSPVSILLKINYQLNIGGCITNFQNSCKTTFIKNTVPVKCTYIKNINLALNKNVMEHTQTQLHLRVR